VLTIFVVDGAPKVMQCPVDLHNDFVKMPSPFRYPAPSLDPFLLDLGGEHRTEAVPPLTHGLVADVDSTLGQ